MSMENETTRKNTRNDLMIGQTITFLNLHIYTTWGRQFEKKHRKSKNKKTTSM